jgi:hypothetical protein
LLRSAARALGSDIPVAGLLDDLPAALEQLDLAHDLVSERVVQRLERVHVLDLGLGAELGLSSRRTLTFASTRIEPSSMLQSEIPSESQMSRSFWAKRRASSGVRMSGSLTSSMSPVPRG